MDEKDKDILESAVALATLKIKLEQMRLELDQLWHWKRENEPVLIWARNYMEAYRGTLRMVYGAGAITIIGLLIQVYYTLGKGK